MDETTTNETETEVDTEEAAVDADDGFGDESETETEPETAVDPADERLSASEARVRMLRGRLFELNESRLNDAAIADYNAWLAEAEALKTEYPDFDLRAEAADPKFTALLGAGVDIRTAYTALHCERIIEAAAENARRQFAADLLRRGARPAENGTCDHSAAVGKPDISALSRSEVEAIERRVARGEKIYLK